MTFENLQIILNKCIDIKGKFSTKKLLFLFKTEVDENLFNIFIKDNYGDLKVRDVFYLLKHGFKTAILCKNENCKNVVRKISGCKRQNINYGFLLFCSKKCADSCKETIEKRKSTNIEKYGGYGFASKEHTRKATTTMLKKYGKKFYVETDEFKEKSKITYMKNWGVENPMGSEELRKLHEKSMLEKYNITHTLQKGTQFREQAIKTVKEKYGNSQIMRTAYMRKLKEASNMWIPLEQKNNFELYKRIVEWFTLDSIRINDIENFHKRGRLDLKNDAFHLDHRISVYAGFKNNIPPFIIGSLYNLEMIPAIINCSKQQKCSMSIDELLDLFYVNF